MPDPSMTLILPDSGATENLGRAMALAFTSAAGELGQPGCVLYLQGELGAGKTTSARSLLHALGVVGIVRSPTYTLVDTYEIGDFTCVHVDLYRCRSPLEIDELGLRDALEPKTLMMIEWPEKGGAAVPPPDLILRLDYAGESRSASIGSASGRGATWLKYLVKDTSLASYVSNIT